MSRVLGEQFRDRLSDLGLSHVAERDSQYIQGRELSGIFDRTGIVQRSASPGDIDLDPWHQHGYDDTPRELSSSEPLRTSQTHLVRAGFLDYLEHGPPSVNPHDSEDDRPYLPQVYGYGPRGNTWIGEGHHRIITSRLRDEPSITVLRGSVDLKQGR